MHPRTLFHVVWRMTLPLLAIAPTAAADSNGWAITEIYSNADGSVQFIELFNTVDLEDQLATLGVGISSSLSTLMFDVDLPDPLTANHFFLVGTVSYTAAQGAVAPDYTVQDNFFSVNDETIIYADVDVVDFAMGELPTDGLLSIDRDLVTSPNSPTNFDGQIGQVDEQISQVVPEPPLPFLAPALSNEGLAVLAVSLVGATLWLARRQRLANN